LSREEYERGLAVPLGQEWNTGRVHAKKIRPRVVVKAGEVVEPQRVRSTSSIVHQH
jgi:U3 small nucleolar RNA-associated protein 14